MADVFLAVTQSAGFEKLVVIKQLRESLAEDPSFVAMFMDEARLAARLNHPNVVQTLEVGTDEATGSHFIAMEFLEGVAHVRFARLKERVPPPLAFHLRILIDTLRGLHYAHELCDFDGKPLNVVHRDVSPQNVMLTFAGGVKVLDFGIAKAALAAEQRPEDFKGKLEYMAPEQAMLDDVDRRADIFSVGVMLWEALTRRRLYRKGEDKFRRLISGELPDVLTVAPTTPKRLAAICAKAMSYDRAERYATADEMADDLEEWLESTAQHVTARDVGSYIADKFASTRTKINAAIEAQLALFRSLSDNAPDTLPISRLPVTDLPPPDEGPSSIPAGANPALPSTPNGWETSEGSMIAASSPRITPPPSSTRQSNSVLVSVVSLVGVAMLGGIVAVAQSTGKRGDTLAKPSASASAPATTKARPDGDESIELTIKASPKDARILVDGKPFGSNPVTETRPKDSRSHVIRIEANGYEPREETIAFDRSVLINIELRPLASSTSTPPETNRSGRSIRPPRSNRPTGGPR